MPDPSVQPPEGLRVIYRYEVPVDDQWHLIALSGPILHVDGRTPHVVEFWALHQGAPTVERAFRVFGTGQPLPLDAGLHRGTVLAAGGRLVWHLFEHQ